MENNSEKDLNNENLLENEMNQQGQGLLGSGHGILGLPIALQRRLIVGIVVGVISYFAILYFVPTIDKFVAFIAAIFIAIIASRRFS